MELRTKTNVWMEEEEDEQLIECKLLPVPVLEDDPLQLTPPLIVDPLETMRITRRSNRISKIASPSKSVGESSSVKPVMKTEPDEDEVAIKKETDEDCSDSSVVSTYVKERIIQTCKELLEEDEKRKQRHKILSEAEKRKRREREMERRRKKRAEKEERLEKEGKGKRIRKPPKLLSEAEKKRSQELFNEQRRQKRATESEAEKKRRRELANEQEKRANESEAEKEKRLKMVREWGVKRRQQETELEKEKRRKKDQEKKRMQRKQESLEQTEMGLQIEQESFNAELESVQEVAHPQETELEREERLTKGREARKNRMQSSYSSVPK